MVQNKKFLVCFLQHRNTNYVVTAFLHLAEALAEKPELRRQCKVIIAASARNNAQLYKLKICHADLFDIDIFECPPSYPDKIRAVIDAYPPDMFDFFIKHDEDLFLSPDSWRKLLLLSPSKLQDKKHLLTTVNLSTGIPTWHSFTKTFFDHSFLQQLEDRLAHDVIPDTVWNNHYANVIAYMNSIKTWNEDAYWESVNREPYDYKGIHPVRLNLFYSQAINDAILARYDDFLNAKTLDTFTAVHDKYFCNSFFIMHYKTYRAIFEDQSLYVDLFDEVPINRYLQKHNLDFLVLDGSLGVHIMYNSAYGQKTVWRNKKYYGNEIEDEFSREYFTRIVRITSKHNPCLHGFSPKTTPLSEMIRRNITQHELYRKLRAKMAGNKRIKSLYKKLIGH